MPLSPLFSLSTGDNTGVTNWQAVRWEGDGCVRYRGAILFWGEWLGSTVIIICPGELTNLEGSIAAVSSAGQQGQEAVRAGQRLQIVRLFGLGCRGEGRETSLLA